jgi:hypothetical protein
MEEKKEEKKTEEKSVKVHHHHKVSEMKQDWKLLSSPKRKHLFLKLLFTLLPMIAYIVVCTIYLVNDAASDKDWYKSSHTMEVPADLEEVSGDSYCNVIVGGEVISINNISPANSSFLVEYNVWFDFNVKEYKKMCDKYNTNAERYTLMLPASNFDLGGKATPYGAYPKQEGDNYSYDWDEKTHTSSVGGSFALPNDSTRFRQTMKVLSTVHKDFTSPRYPLESTQFTFYVSPTISSRYLRYVTDTSSYSYGGSLKSFLSPTISISDGFTLIKDEDNQLVSDIYYYKDTSTDRTVIDSLGNPLASSYKTELRLTVRCNRTSGWSLFLQAFLTLFAVMAWNFISFYNAAFNHEDVLANLGAGLFSAVSSVLIGLSLISDSQGFALVNMVNIFALVIILLMTFILMNEKRAHNSDDKEIMAAHDLYMKTVFFVLLFLNLCCFILLPSVSFLWGL